MNMYVRGVVRCQTMDEMIDYNLEGKNFEEIISQQKVFNVTPISSLSLVVNEDILPLKETTKEDIQKLRKKNAPMFILKISEKIFYTLLKEDANLSGLLGKVHACAWNDVTCARLSAAPDPTGCAKVRPTKKCIEEYDFIRFGYQVVNMQNTCLFVGVCNNFQKAVRKKLDVMQIRQARIALAEFALPDGKVLEGIKKRNANRFRDI